VCESDELLRDFDSKKKTGAGGGRCRDRPHSRTISFAQNRPSPGTACLESQSQQKRIDIFGFNFCLFESVRAALLAMSLWFHLCGNATLFDSVRT